MTEWGFCSPGLKRAGAYQIKRGAAVTSRTANAFIRQDASFRNFREGQGYSAVSNWVPNEEFRFLVAEQYLVVPSTQQMLVFITADENDVADDYY